MQRAYVECNKFQLNDSAKFFFDKVHEIAAPEYVPTVEDIVKTRVRTTGILEESYTVDGVDFVVYDVGGQRNERRKWIHAFDDVSKGCGVYVCVCVCVELRRMRGRGSSAVSRTPLSQCLRPQVAAIIFVASLSECEGLPLPPPPARPPAPIAPLPLPDIPLQTTRRSTRTTS